MTKHSTILDKLPSDVRDSVKSRTVEIWTFIYNYVAEHGYADCLDEAFIDQVRSRFKISSRSLSGHLRRMRRAGLIKAWVGTLGRGQTSPRLAIFLGFPPTRIMRYTLPSQQPPNELYRSQK